MNSTMISSSRLTGTGYQDASSGQHRRVITNFSIDSIIGECSLAKKSADKKESKHKQDDSEKMQITNVPSGVIKKKVRPKNFQCPGCPMAFSNNGQLRNHVRIHTGERPFRCNFDDCGKTFTRNEELTRHKLIHTGFRPHACPSCGKQFGRKDHLKKHVRTHDKVRKSRKLVKTHDVIVKQKLNQVLEEPIRSLSSKTGICDQGQQVLACGVSQEVSKQAGNVIDQFPRHQQADLHPLSSGLFPHLPLVNTTLLPTSCFTTANNPFEQQAATASTITTMANIGPNQPGQFPADLLPTTMGNLQKLASDYWRNWYQILGLQGYQHAQDHYSSQHTNFNG